PRSVLLAGFVALPACYVGLDGEPPEGTTLATSTGGAGTSTGAASDPTASSAAPTGEPTTGAEHTSTGPVTATVPGTTDMSGGTGGTTGLDTGGEPGTSEPGTTEPGTTGMTGDPPPDEAAMLCARWNDDRAQLGEGTWSGDVDSCNKGGVSADGLANTLRLVNLYRFIADLPPVVEDAARSGKAQSCALMMHANGTLNHSPPMNWKCYAAEGAEAAGQSNIAGAPGVFGIDLYMVDDGNTTTIGHRRWILSNSLGPIGMGSTSQYSCLLVIGGNGNAGKAWTAWPPPGLVPLQAMHVPTVGWSDVDKAGWSVQSDSIDLGGATVSVTEGGVDRPVAVNVLGQGYGSTHAIRFVPQGWAVEAGKTYDVTLGNVSQPIAYSVAIVDCG
ncbi:MAG TPA: CAP domain-containing protein, partial [Nannocystis sp.]